MTPIATQHLARSIETLESSLASLRGAPAESIEFEVFRNAVVKGFELTLETTGKLLRRALKEYVAVPRQIDVLEDRDVLRAANKHGLLTEDEVGRWLTYRNHRSCFEHELGVEIHEVRFGLMADFAMDARHLESMLRERLDRVDA